VKVEDHIMRDHCYVKRHIIEVPEPIEEMVVVDDASQVSSPYETTETIEIETTDTSVTAFQDDAESQSQDYLSSDYSYSPKVHSSGSPESSLLDPELDELLLGNSSENSDCEEKQVLDIADLLLGIDSFSDLNVPNENVEKSLVDVDFDDFKVEEFFANANSLSDLDNLHF